MDEILKYLLEVRECNYVRCLLVMKGQENSSISIQSFRIALYENGEKILIDTYSRIIQPCR